MNGLYSLIQLSHSQWWSAQHLAYYRDLALARLIQHAYWRVPYYRRLMDGVGVRPEDIRTVADLGLIPETTKSDLQRVSLEDRMAQGVRRRGWRKSSTSGATATPLEMVVSPAERGRFSAAFLSIYRAWGMSPFDRLLIFESRPYRLKQRSWYERLGIFRRLRVSTLEPAYRWIEVLQAWKPRLVQGHAPTLKLLAEAVRATRSKVHVPLVVSTGATLDPAGRKLITSVLGARVADVYASVEGGVIAWECPVCGQHHVNEDSVVLELLKDGRPALEENIGGVVITALGNYAAPIIRYDQGDIAAMSAKQPVCGRSLRLLKTVFGRSNDFVVLPSGRLISPHPFHALMDASAGVSEWQLIQQKDGSLDMTVVALGTDSGYIERKIIAALRNIAGNSIVIRVSLVEHIKRDPMQKTRCIISHARGARGNPEEE